MFEAIAGFFGAFFILGGFWFWVLFAVFFGGLVALADHEENFWAGVITAVFFFGIFHFNPLLQINWVLVPWIVLGYLALGAVMSFIKWITYLKIRASKYADLKEEWYDRRKSKYPDLPIIDKATNMKQVLSDDQYTDFISALKSNNFITHREHYIIPRFKDKYKKLVAWALWWPAVIFWSLLNDYIRGAFNAMVKSMRKWYENIARKVFSGVGVDMHDNDDQLY